MNFKSPNVNFTMILNKLKKKLMNDKHKKGVKNDGLNPNSVFFQHGFEMVISTLDMNWLLLSFIWF